MAIYIGDTHGNFPYMKQAFGQRQKTNYVHVGDFGLLHSGAKLSSNPAHNPTPLITGLNDALVRSKSMAYINRGNHDNPKFWQDSDWSMSNIKFVPDYGVVNIEGKNTLFLGGAVSIDRLVMDRDKYFVNEIFNYDQFAIDKIMDEQKQIDVVISHTAPEFAFPLGFNNLVYRFAANDPKLLTDLTEERKKLGNVYRVLNTKFKIKRWIYGHFHVGNHMYYNDTQFSCIGVNSFTRNEY